MHQHLSDNYMYMYVSLTTSKLDKNCIIWITFSHNVFYPLKDKTHHLSYIYFVICKHFQFRPIQNFVILVKS